jgi:hypothetical protein
MCLFLSILINSLEVFVRIIIAFTIACQRAVTLAFAIALGDTTILDFVQRTLLLPGSSTLSRGRRRRRTAVHSFALVGLSATSNGLSVESDSNRVDATVLYRMKSHSTAVPLTHVVPDGSALQTLALSFAVFLLIRPKLT